MDLDFMSSLTCGALQPSCNQLRIRYHHVEIEDLQVLCPEHTVVLYLLQILGGNQLKIGYISFRGLLDSGDQLLERMFPMRGTGGFV